MDDSVIKVLRRNGSWQNSSNKAENALSNNKVASGKNLKDEDFKLDEKFQILASEIKNLNLFCSAFYFQTLLTKFQLEAFW